ncbi:MAG: hypothetical protein IJ325_05770 [Clostridia bacterium]|nr:hypothetical protein [Clostridia bacterium]
MKTKLFKGVSVLLAITLLIIASSFYIGAADFEQAVGLAASNDGEVKLDGTNPGSVTVSIVCKENLTCYNIEGLWDIHEQEGSENFTLTGLAFNEDLNVVENDDFADVPTGQISWVDDEFEALEMTEGYVLATATYAVAAGTPAGTYTLGFTKTVFTGADGEPDETEVEFTVTITVAVDEPEAEGLKGDVDLDGDVDVDDLTYLAEHVAKIITITNTTSLSNAEVTGDSSVSVDDLTKLAEYVAKIIPSLD